MENHRKRIIELVKKNIVSKISHNSNLSDENKRVVLLKEIDRNKSLFLNSDKDEAEAKEKKDFVLDILKQLGWSLELADEVLTEETPIGEKLVVSKEKMEAFTDLYESESTRLKKEVDDIVYSDSVTGRYGVLYSRLREIKSAKGASWDKEEIDFVIDKRDKGYSFRAIAKVLKRPERVVRLKYHDNK